MGKFDERIEEFGLLVGAHETARRVEEIPLDRVIPDPGNPRRSFDDDALAELAASIAARGVLQPITVAPADAAGLHRIRLGERRFRASELAGLVTIPAIVVAEEGTHLLADQIVENDQRANLSSVELAHAIARMLKGGMSQVEIAAALGRSKQFVSLYAAYGDMPAYLRRRSRARRSGCSMTCIAQPGIILRKSRPMWAPGMRAARHWRKARVSLPG
jgi:ParB family chromosome partitioning protein